MQHQYAQIESQQVQLARTRANCREPPQYHDEKRSLRIRHHKQRNTNPGQRSTAVRENTFTRSDVDNRTKNQRQCKEAPMLMPITAIILSRLCSG